MTAWAAMHRADEISDGDLRPLAVLARRAWCDCFRLIAVGQRKAIERSLSPGTDVRWEAVKELLGVRKVA